MHAKRTPKDVCEEATFHAASAENWREKSLLVSSLLELSLFHHNVDKIMLNCISAPEGN